MVNISSGGSERYALSASWHRKMGTDRLTRDFAIEEEDGLWLALAVRYN